MICFCEGSCPACIVGEVEDHRCNLCQREYCPTCHGIKSGDPSKNVLPCVCLASKDKDAEIRRLGRKLAVFSQTREPRLGDELGLGIARLTAGLDPNRVDVLSPDFALGASAAFSSALSAVLEMPEPEVTRPAA